MSETDINKILVNGATISLEKLRRASNFESLLFHYAEISVYLEVSLSEGAGISDWSRQALAKLFADAASVFMDRKRHWHRDEPDGTDI
ncbi:excinuclease ABC subunit C [Pokkaliibacter sp. CJK22405]|uniref:excinuclease ABC subunit C n=1 Tax=Pokkaliibacter sp. CJK22405 TaxID=3384615 RepID=UPI003984DEDB